MADAEFQHRVNAGKREILLEKARTASTPAITFQDFVNVVSVCFNAIVMLLHIFYILNGFLFYVLHAYRMEMQYYFTVSKQYAMR